MSQQTTSTSAQSTDVWSDERWSKVKIAIVKRWPHIQENEVEAVACDLYAIEEFLSEYTKSTPDEIQSVVREFAPTPSIMQRASHFGEQVTEQVSERVASPMKSAFERARYEVDEHRGTASGLIFVTGLALGVLATAAYFKSQRQPSCFQSYLPDRWTR